MVGFGRIGISQAPRFLCLDLAGSGAIDFPPDGVPQVFPVRSAGASPLYSGDLVPRNKHPYLGDKMLRSFNRIRQALAKSRKEHEALFANDPYLDRLTIILQGVGNPSPDLQNLHEKARHRYAAKIPPGYADAKDKGEPAAVGDFIAWSQLIEISKSLRWLPKRGNGLTRPGVRPNGRGCLPTRWSQVLPVSVRV